MMFSIHCATRNFSGDLAKHVRVALTSFYESLILCCETMDQFGPPKSLKYDFN